MNKDTELKHLFQANKAIADGERHIARQERRVAELDRDGHDTKRALSVLGLYRGLQAQQVAHRRLVFELLCYANHSKRLFGPIFRPGHYDGSVRS